MKATEAIVKEFQKTLDLLPKGSINKIASMTGCKQSYVSRFFRGDYEITTANEKIIDAAIYLLEQAVINENRIKSKLSAATKQTA